MNWKQLLFPSQLRSWMKRGRRLKAAATRPVLTLLLFAGWPSPVSNYLGPRRFRARLYLFKQGIWSYVVGDRFVRFASDPRAADKLQLEYSMWNQLRELGLAAVLPRSVVLHAERASKILETDLLSLISKEEHVAVTLPIMRELVAAAKPMVHNTMPETISAGLRLGGLISEGTLPDSFANEAQIRECFAQPLLTGASHRDLHHLNVMRDVDGRPVLIDLKSCDLNRILAIDLLNFACKYLQARSRQNYLEVAFAVHQSDWHVPELEPVMALVDLPRPLWGQILVLHGLGLHALKLRSPDAVGMHIQRPLRRILARDWRVLH
ncbi:MAG: hypothetical protein ACOZAM_21140 [Pseudomonadota bacterium]